jgi:iron complex outermembrane receptor protein
MFDFYRGNNMSFQHSILSSAMLALFTPICSSSFAQSIPEVVVVTANPLGKGENLQILSPTKVLSGTELRAKIGSSLGETLSNELGVTASGFGAGASRPIIRGLEGPRVKVLQNGMNVADVSSISNDHAVASETASAQQIEILRGPAALLYGSGAIGGLVNVVDGRIPNHLTKAFSGEAELKYGSVNLEKSASFFMDGASGDIALHLDGNTRKSSDYKIPGFAIVDDKTSSYGTIPSSFTKENSLGMGASIIKNWGHIGASFQTMKDQYGIPTEEQSFIDLKQNRFDIDAAIMQAWGIFDDAKFKLGASDYQHTEKEKDGTPATNFKNKSLETRLSFAHANWVGWEGNWGFQTESSQFSALSAATGRSDTVPTTQSLSIAAFAVEQRRFGDVVTSVGGRLEKINRKPQAEFKLLDREFNLGSASIGAMWELVDGYGLVASYSSAQRAPTTEELYSNGPHESTATYDVGNVSLKKEASNNIDLSLQNTVGIWRWKINVFNNAVKNYVYGDVDGVRVNEVGNVTIDGNFSRRYWRQAPATIRGGEAEISFNHLGDGLSYRAFADTSHATLDQQGNLPLQPANRVGVEVGFKHAGWRHNLSMIHAQKQNRLAQSEQFITPSYTKIDLNITYTHAYQSSQATWFLQAKNLLNQDIRLSTSILRESVPQAMRGIIAGVRVAW